MVRVVRGFVFGRLYCGGVDMSMVRDWLLERLTERSTWATLITGSATLIGIGIAPEKAEAITGLGMFIASLIGIATRER